MRNKKDAAYLSLETNRREVSMLLRIMRRVSGTETEAAKKAKALLAITKGMVGSILAGRTARPERSCPYCCPTCTFHYQ
jgi:hypothetical protein